VGGWGWGGRGGRRRSLLGVLEEVSFGFGWNKRDGSGNGKGEREKRTNGVFIIESEP